MVDSIKDTLTKIERTLGSRILIILVVISAFIITIIPLSSVSITEMGTGEFFFEEITPIFFWIGLVAIFCVLFYCIFHLDFSVSKNVGVFVFGAISLMILMRIVFPIVFQSIITYEPDVSNYLKIENSWLHGSLDFGQSGNYEHDYPLAFIFAFLFAKLGAPLEIFFRFAPFFIYAADFALVFVIINEITLKPKVAALAVFLFAISPLNYWLAVHYCPDLLGSLFFLLALYLVIRLVKTESLKPGTVIPVIAAIILLVLTHHLSTLYFILTIMGLAFSSWYFKSPFKPKAIYFLIVGTFAYTFWFMYGTFMYPEFFNVYTYFSQSGSAITLSTQANLFQNFTFALYPLFIVALVTLYIKETVGLRNILKFITSRKFLHPTLMKFELSAMMQYTSGFILVLALFFVGLVIPSIFAPRVPRNPHDRFIPSRRCSAHEFNFNKP